MARRAPFLMVFLLAGTAAPVLAQAPSGTAAPGAAVGFSLLAEYASSRVLPGVQVRVIDNRLSFQATFAGGADRRTVLIGGRHGVGHENYAFLGAGGGFSSSGSGNDGVFFVELGVAAFLDGAIGPVITGQLRQHRRSGTWQLVPAAQVGIEFRFR